MKFFSRSRDKPTKEQRATDPTLKDFIRVRHTNISMQIMTGVPLKTVSVRAGHSSTKVTSDVYSHFLKTSDRDAADKLDSLFGNK